MFLATSFFATVSFLLRLRGTARGSYFAKYWEVVEPSYDRATVNRAGKLVGKGVPVMNFTKNI